MGFVLINIAPAYELEVFTRLSRLPEVIELYPLFGEYDVIAKVVAENFDYIGHIVVNKIRKIKGVRNTVTLTGIKFIAGL